jgi:hypothetical protein
MSSLSLLGVEGKHVPATYLGRSKSCRAVEFSAERNSGKTSSVAQDMRLIAYTYSISHDFGHPFCKLVEWIDEWRFSSSNLCHVDIFLQN